MKKYLIIMATLALLLLVFAPAAFAQEGDAGAAGGYGGGWGGYGGGWGGPGGGWGGSGGGWNNCGGSYYCVRYGDTLFSIGRMFNVNPWHIAHVNQLPNPNCIYAGQKLYIPPTDGHPYPWPAHHQMPPMGWHPMPPVSGPEPIPPMWPHPMPPVSGPHPMPYGQSDSGYGYESSDGYVYGAPEQGYGNY